MLLAPALAMKRHNGINVGAEALAVAADSGDTA
jgi:hypothetical protein